MAKWLIVLLICLYLAIGIVVISAMNTVNNVNFDFFSFLLIFVWFIPLASIILLGIIELCVKLGKWIGVSIRGWRVMKAWMFILFFVDTILSLINFFEGDIQKAILFLIFAHVFLVLYLDRKRGGRQ
jgi:hypothetical protein